ncbi:MAG: hypothetical protein KC502_15670 [Myxococcales bacterium]|nr:hypothetical protein [Myxococcales bacterium]
MTTWTCRETTQLAGLRACVERGNDLSTWHVKAALSAPAHPDNWWFSASDGGGRVGAFAAISGTRASLYGDDEDAVEAMARTMLRSQHLHTSRESHRHVLFGPANVVNPFWRIFRDVGRQVVADRRPSLMCSGGEGKGSRRMSFSTADSSDLKTCVAFLAEHSAEHDGVDPRKVAPQAFSRDVAARIAAGRLVIGREVAKSGGERAMFVAEVGAMGEDVVMLRPMHVPMPFRSRKILVSGALLSATQQGPGAGKRVWVLVEGDALHLGAERAGYRDVLAWREVAMLG